MRFFSFSPALEPPQPAVCLRAAPQQPALQPKPAGNSAVPPGAADYLKLHPQHFPAAGCFAQRRGQLPVHPAHAAHRKFCRICQCIVCSVFHKTFPVPLCRLGSIEMAQRFIAAHNAAAALHIIIQRLWHHHGLLDLQTDFRDQKKILVQLTLRVAQLCKDCAAVQLVPRRLDHRIRSIFQ